MKVTAGGLIYRLGHCGEQLKAELIHFMANLSGSEGSVSDDHAASLAGWKSRKQQLYKQQESVMKVNDEAEGISIISLSKKGDNSSRRQTY